MSGPQTLSDHLRTGTRLMYSYCESVSQFEALMIDGAPNGYSIFVYEPNSLECLRYVHKGHVEDTVMKRFNDINKGRINLLDILLAGRLGVMSALSGKSQSTPIEKIIPPKSIILCECCLDEVASPEVKSKLMRIAKSAAYANYGLHLVFYSDNPILDSFLTQHGTEIRIPPISDDDVREHFRKRAEAEKRKAPFLANREIVDAMVNSVRGLPLDIIDSIIDWCIIKHPNSRDVHLFTEYADEVQAKAIKQSDVLSFLPYGKQSDPKYIGGYEVLLHDVEEAAVGFSPKALALGIEPPKGIVLVGVPGTGKTMAAQAMGRILGLRVVVMNMSSVFGKYLGDSEGRILKALKQIENFGRCVLFIDEADKSMGGGNDSNDSGTTQRVLGIMLKWLQDRREGVYVVMTMNNFKNVQMEFMRAGRVDNIYFSGFPTPNARMSIFASHFHKRNVKNIQYRPSQWADLMDATKLWTGSEIETVVNESMRLAFLRREVAVPTFDELMEKVNSRTPMSQSDPERIMAILRTCYGRFRSVGSEVNPEVTEYIKRYEK